MLHERIKQTEEAFGRGLSDTNEYQTWVGLQRKKQTVASEAYRSISLRQFRYLTHHTNNTIAAIFGRSDNTEQRKPHGLPFLGEMKSYLQAMRERRLHAPIPEEKRGLLDLAQDCLHRALEVEIDPQKQAMLFISMIANSDVPQRLLVEASDTLSDRNPSDVNEPIEKILLLQQQARERGDEYANFLQEVLMNRERLARSRIDQLALLCGREAAARQLITDFRGVIDTSKALGDKFSFEETTGRNVLSLEDTRLPRIRNVDDLLIPDSNIDSYDNLESLPLRRKAELLQEYFIQLTRQYNPTADLSEDFQTNLVAHLEETLNSGKPLSFSVFLSLKKFANPLDTKDSHIDLGEFRLAKEMKQFIDVVKQISGMKPDIIIMDESLATRRFTQASDDVYRSELSRLFENVGIPDQVKIVPFSRKIFVDYLLSRDSDQLAEFGLTDITGVRASNVVVAMENYLAAIYQGINTRKITLSDGQLVFGRKFSICSDLPQPLTVAINDYAANNFADFIKEADISITIGVKRNLDPSVMFPVMSESLWEMVTKRREKNLDIKKTVEIVGQYALEQAVIQGLSFRALMKMRYVMNKLFPGQAFMEFVSQNIHGEKRSVTPFSITTSPDKLSWSLGRSAHTGIKFDGVEVEGVHPQHGVGVVIDGKIVSIPWQTVRNNLSRFYPITVEVGDMVLQGYEFIRDE